MTATGVEEPTRYRFPGPDGALWLGLRPAAVATVAVTVLVTVAALYAGAPLPVALVVLAAGGSVAVAPAGGRPAVEWAGAAVRHAARRVGGGSRWSAGTNMPQALTAGAALRLPAEYGRLRLVEAATAVGVVEDLSARALTAVLAVAGPDRFAVLDPADQAVRLAGWAAVLSTIAADPDVRRVQWVQRAGPDLRDPAAWLRERADDRTGVTGYLELAARAAAAATRHEVWLAVAWRRPAGRERSAGRVVDRVRDLTASLLAADLLTRPLTAGEIGWLLRRGADHTAPPAAPPSVLDMQVGPASRRCGWSELRTDDSWHRSFAVAGWPRLPVPQGWLEPLLAAPVGPAVRTMSVHLEPVAAAVAAREVRAARAKARLDTADRARLGFTDDVASAWAQTDAADAEAELLAGYRMHRVSAVLTCSAGSPAELDEACRALRVAAATARVDLRPLHGEQHTGFLASLPLCRAGGTAR